MTKSTNGPDSHREAPKRPWDEIKGSLYLSTASPLYPRVTGGASAMRALPPPVPNHRKLLGLSALGDDVASTVVPPVTVVREGRSICHRIYLNKHSSYRSLAMALRRMFVDVDDKEDLGHGDGTDGIDLSNAVPGYVVAYEDMEDDLLLAGDLNWKDFVRVAKRIRIIPAKASRRKHCQGP
ncbi:auxin-responsive protein IAA33 [Phoenix dactylifera]|uniref:Auxin-responsive protein n=1 Tax=Phoenix dactylifera TaxID=42345 RepID=A0A8B7D1W1_PHODC|nr:auxin-responsive protein IAA33 [Phoenix dactylifera]